MNPDRLTQELYDELRRIASIKMRAERTGHTLQTTALVHEAYLKLSRRSSAHWTDEAHFLAAAARAMREILVDHARTHKRRVKLLEGNDASFGRALPEVDMAELSVAIDALELVHERPAKVFQMRYILGMSVIEVAELFELSERTIKGESRIALAWLRRYLTRS